jgi:HK97 family phage major capsid protein
MRLRSNRCALRFTVSDIEQDIQGLSRAVTRLASAQEYRNINVREPSRAHLFGQPRDNSAGKANEYMDAHPLMKASFGDTYRAGDFIRALVDARSSDYEEQMRGKAALMEIGARYDDMPELSKATLGATGATGGYVLPNNLVASLVKPAVTGFSYANLVTVRTGVNVRGVDQPFRTGAPSRATFQDWGSTKENVNEAYGSYTATLGTLARIYDVGKQYLRFSAGAAEQDVIDELTKAMRLGENYYMLAGAGTGSVGSGDPTTGIYTGLNARPGFKSTFSSASNSTVLGSFAAACSQAIQALAQRSWNASAIVCDSVTFYTATRQGSDTAGFWVDPAGGPTGFNIGPNGVVRYWDVPIFADPNFDSYTGTTKAMIAADWSQFKLYRGLEFRVDSSDVAGNRWDTNLVGFRGEEEIGFHAGSAIETGCAQLMLSVIP